MCIRDSPDTSVMVEGDKSYVYKINDENIANKTEVKTVIEKLAAQADLLEGINNKFND